MGEILSEYIIHNGVFYSSDELVHHGVKGMKWGVRKTIRQTSDNARRVRNAMTAANIERRQARIKRTISRNKSLQKQYNIDYRNQNKKYRAKLKRLETMRNSKISELSEVDIERGRAMYNTIKSIGVSVTVAAATTAIGTAYAPAAVVAKVIGAGLTTAINGSNND